MKRTLLSLFLFLTFVVLFSSAVFKLISSEKRDEKAPHIQHTTHTYLPKKKASLLKKRIKKHVHYPRVTYVLYLVVVFIGVGAIILCLHSVGEKSSKNDCRYEVFIGKQESTPFLGWVCQWLSGVSHDNIAQGHPKNWQWQPVENKALKEAIKLSAMKVNNTKAPHTHKSKKFAFSLYPCDALQIQQKEYDPGDYREIIAPADGILFWAPYMSRTLKKEGEKWFYFKKSEQKDKSWQQITNKDCMNSLNAIQNNRNLVVKYSLVKDYAYNDDTNGDYFAVPCNYMLQFNPVSTVAYKNKISNFARFAIREKRKQ